MDTISFRNVPVNWQLCFLDDCPVKDKCLRQLVAHHLSDDCTFGPAIYPTMKRGDEGCRLFATSEPQRMAWGFTTLFSEVKSRDEHRLRNSIKDYLGAVDQEGVRAVAAAHAETAGVDYPTVPEVRLQREPDIRPLYHHLRL